jgi:hypothetical protein
VEMNNNKVILSEVKNLFGGIIKISIRALNRDKRCYTFERNKKDLR